MNFLLAAQNDQGLLDNWDYTVIVLFLVFTFAIGYICKAVAKNGSDFFRGGGNMLWWMTGMSGVASGLSAWTFCAAASRTYEMGFFMVVQFWLWIPAYWVMYKFLAARYRQMRVVTVCDAIRERYGRFTEQFFVWFVVPANLVAGVMWLLTISLIMAAATGIGITECIIVLGVTVGVVSLSAGAWSVIASDFIQMLVIIVGAIAVCVCMFMLPEVGGISGFKEKLPDKFLNFSLTESAPLWITFFFVQMFMRLMQVADLSKEGAKMFSAKDGKTAKKSTLLMLFAFPIVPLIVFLPVMASYWVLPDLGTLLPGLDKPQEGAYIAIAAHVLPSGMVGLIACAMFSASISSMDTALNRNAGFFVKNFYQVYIRPDATDKQVIFVARVCTMVFTVLLIALAIILSNNREMGMFELSNLIFALAVTPMLIPTVLGIFFKKTPQWSGWSTILVAIAVAFFAKHHLDHKEIAMNFFNAGEVNKIEERDTQYVVMNLLTVAAGVSWFFFTSLFYKNSSAEYRESVDNFFEKMNTPIVDNPEATPESDAMQYRIVGSLCLIFGIALSLGVLIPNDLQGRIIFLVCGGVITFVGWLLYRNYLRLNKSK